MSLEEEHGDYMRQAIEVACQNLRRPFATIIVDERRGEVVGKGLCRNYKNPTGHSELEAIAKAVEHHGEDISWKDCTLYSTAEPNVMNIGAILWTGIPRVVFGTSLATLKQLGYRHIDITAQEVVNRSGGMACTLVPGVLAQECDELFAAAIRLEAL